YDLEHDRYEPVAPDARGYVRCEPLGLYLGVFPGYLHAYREEAPWLRWVDDAGTMLPHWSEVRDREAERAAREAERAAREAGRASAGEAENARLREELERVRRGS